MRMKSAKIAVVFVAGALGITACSGTATHASTSTANSGGTKTVTTIRYMQPSSSFAYLPFYAANVEGYFKANNINIAREPDTAVTIPSLLAGQANITTDAPPAALNAMAANRDIVALGLVLPTNPNQLVLSNKIVAQLAKKGVTPKSSLRAREKALKGLTLNVSSQGSGVNQGLRILIKEAGLNPDTDVKLVVQADPTADVNALRVGQSDGYAFPPPVSTEAVSGGFGTVWLNFNESPQLKHSYTLLAFTTHAFANAHSQAVIDYLKAFNAGLQAVVKNKAGLMDKIQKQYFSSMNPAAFNLAYKSSQAQYSDSMFPTTSGYDTMMQQTAALTAQPLTSLTMKKVFDLTYLEDALKK